MYNFYRWYPLGKIVFTAPTRPLVAQQIEACYDIIAIPPNDTIEMTGWLILVFIIKKCNNLQNYLSYLLKDFLEHILNYLVKKALNVS